MLMTLLRWQARILNQMFKTDRYDKLADLQLKTPDDINYSLFFDMTPGINPTNHQQIIDVTNKLCRSSTPSLLMQQHVIYLNQYVGSRIAPQSPQHKTSPYSLQHVVIYSSLSKCKIWPKVLKSGMGFVPVLIQFYNSFTRDYGELLDYKFDPVILSQKYTKIMKKVNLRKKDFPKLIEAIKNSNNEEILKLLNQAKNKTKNNQPMEMKEKTEGEDNCDDSFASILNNICHKNKGVSHICCEGSSLETMKLLHQLGTDFQALDEQKQTAIFFAVKRNDLEIVKYLVEVVKVNVNHRQYQDRSALYLAAFEGNCSIVDYLYKNGANPQLCSKLDRTPLSKACYLGNIEVVKYLLGIQVDMFKQDNKGRTALHNAVWGIQGGRDGKRRGTIVLQDSPECAELLIRAGHPVDFQDYDGFTPFFSAVSSNAVRSVRLLHQFGANMNHKTKNKESAVFIGAKYGHFDVIKILVQEYGLNYVDMDYNGYTPLCASITMQQPKAFFYLCDLYMRNSIKFDFPKLVKCCKQYETTNNLNFIKLWLTKHQNSLTDKQGKQIPQPIKAKALYQELPEIVEALRKTNQEKKSLKQELKIIQKKRHCVYEETKTTTEHKDESNQVEEKLMEMKLQNFGKVLNKNEEEEQTEDHQFINETSENKQTKSTKQTKLTKQKKSSKDRDSGRQARKSEEQIRRNQEISVYLIQINKKLNSLRKVSDFLLMLSSHILVQTENIISSHIHQQGLTDTEETRTKIREQFCPEYTPVKYRNTSLYLLSECVHVFNRGKKSQMRDIVITMQQLAKIISFSHPTISPSISEEALQQFSQFSGEASIDPHKLFNVQLSAHQNQQQLTSLLTNSQVLTNLTRNIVSTRNTLLRLAKYRKTSTVISIFNSRRGMGQFSHDQLLNLIHMSAYDAREGNENDGQEDVSQLNVVQYCLVNGISDIAVFLQEVGKGEQFQFVVNIPVYVLEKKQLKQIECNVDLEPVDSWVLDFDKLIDRISPFQMSLYQRYLQQNIITETNLTNQAIEMTETSEIQTEKFMSCNNYVVVETKSGLLQMEKAISKLVLIGIDVEYYGEASEDFICSIQISGGQTVFIIDPMSHLSAAPKRQQNNEDNCLYPQQIAEFIRKLMSDESKVKIFHAYENDVKWLHEDFDLGSAPPNSNTMGVKYEHKNRNVMDTSRMYNCGNLVKKGTSVGLRTLCKKYLGFDMDKNFQRSDWRIRPLFKQMIKYASLDAEVLPYLFLLMLQSAKCSQKLQSMKEIFCSKRSMKGKGVRNTLRKSDANNNQNKICEDKLVMREG